MRNGDRGSRYFNCSDDPFENGHTASAATASLTYAILAGLISEVLDNCLRVGKVGFGQKGSWASARGSVAYEAYSKLEYEG